MYILELVIFEIAVSGFQFLLFKSKKIHIKLIPLYLTVLVAVFALLIYIGVFGGSSGFINANELLALIMWFVCAVTLAVIAVCRLIWFLLKLKTNKKGVH